MLFTYDVRVKRAVIASSFTIALILLYAFFVEPRWLEITRHEFSADVSQDVKIAHLSDLHFHRFGSIETKVLEAVNAEAPDLILITGDTLDGEGGVPPAKVFFKSLKSPRLGTWAVLGNWENWSGQNTVGLFDKIGVSLLINEKAFLSAGFALLGFDDSLSGKPLRSLSASPKPNPFCISLVHSPKFAKVIANRCPLILAGHTHGGQVRLPLLPPFWLPPESDSYVSGWYDLHGSKMYVSRGIGTSILPVRFFSRPELALITLRRRH